MRAARKVSFSNVLAVIAALYIGAYCTGCAVTESDTMQSVGLAEEDTVMLMLNPRAANPTLLHMAVWSMVRACLDVPPQSIARVRWNVADTIAAYPSGDRPYGVASYRGGELVVIIERRFWFHPSVLSHELVHIIARVTDPSPKIERCTLYAGQDLPARKLRYDALQSVWERAARVPIIR